MPDTTATAGRIAVIDLGSNSLRLVVFERFGGTFFPLLNEKVMCALGRGIASTGRLNAEGTALALDLVGKGSAVNRIAHGCRRQNGEMLDTKSTGERDKPG